MDNLKISNYFDFTVIRNPSSKSVICTFVCACYKLKNKSRKITYTAECMLEKNIHLISSNCPQIINYEKKHLGNEEIW